MSSPGQEFARYAKAERQVCEEAGPALVAAIQSVEARLGIRITEVRVTLERPDATKGALSANCTIVCAREISGSTVQELSDLTAELPVASATSMQRV